FPRRQLLLASPDQRVGRRVRLAGRGAATAGRTANRYGRRDLPPRSHRHPPPAARRLRPHTRIHHRERLPRLRRPGGRRRPGRRPAPDQLPPRPPRRGPRRPRRRGGPAWLLRVVAAGQLRMGGRIRSPVRSDPRRLRHTDEDAEGELPLLRDGHRRQPAQSGADEPVSSYLTRPDHFYQARDYQFDNVVEALLSGTLPRFTATRRVLSWRTTRR